MSGTVTLAAGAYGHDRWKAGAAGCTYTFAEAENVTTITITAGSLVQVIEGGNLFSGTYVLSWAGTAQGRIGAGSYGASGITGAVTGGTNLNIEFGTGTVSLVQFEAGSVATPFERISLGAQLAQCFRYAELVDGGGVSYLSSAAASQLFWLQYTEKRAVPSVAFVGYLQQTSGAAIGAPFYIGTNGAHISMGATSAGQYASGRFLISAEL